MSGVTHVTIDADRFVINGSYTYAGREDEDGTPIEGLLLNSRMVQATFDDENAETRPRWAYPDTGEWDPQRNTAEFLTALPVYRAHGLLAVTLNLQGGSPEGSGYSVEQPWKNSAFDASGALRDDYRTRFEAILDETDQLGMVVILGLFYFGQDEQLRDEAAVRHAVDEAIGWLRDRGDRHIVIEVNNECDVPLYEHEILTPTRVHELIAQVRTTSDDELLVGTSFKGGALPTAEVLQASDLVLLHGNGVDEPRRIGEMVRAVRQMPDYRPMPIVFNEDDHFVFDQPTNNMMEAIRNSASWGYFDPGDNDYHHGYQSPPVRWDLNTPRKQAFFDTVARLTGAAQRAAP